MKPIYQQQSYAEELFEAVVSGVVSIPTTLGLGVRRTYEDVAGSSRVKAENSAERDRMGSLLLRAVKFASSDSGPLTRMLKTILTEYYHLLPDDVLRDMATKAAKSGAPAAAGLGVAHQGSRMATQAALTVAISKLLAMSIGRKTAIRRMTSFGVGAAVNGLMLQGMFEEASQAAKRLRRYHPTIHSKLRAQGLEMAFFLVEKAMAPVLASIRDFNTSRGNFNRQTKQLQSKFLCR